MCLSTVYKNTEDADNILMGNVAKIEINGDIVKITDLMERSMEIDGELLFVDLLGAKAIIKERA